MYHRPVLLEESIKGLRISPNGTYADVTFGGGGHTRGILEQLDNGRVIAFDQDQDALSNTIDDPRLTLVHGNFRYLLQYLRFHNALPVDGILADLGISSHQIDEGARGFSTRFNAPLDMRMDPGQEKSASVLLETISEEDLEKTLRLYGELSNSRRLARAIIEYRGSHPLVTTGDLKDAVRPFIPVRQEHKFLAQLFQAVRIAVNDELEALREMLEQCITTIKPGGRLVVISYHSLEDRLVKHFMRSGNFEDKTETDFFGKSSSPFTPVTRKAVTPTAGEIAANSRARSARLRIAERS